MIIILSTNNTLKCSGQPWPIANASYRSIILKNGTVITYIQAEFSDLEKYYEISGNLSEIYNDPQRKLNIEHYWKLVGKLEKVCWENFTVLTGKRIELVLRRDGCCKQLDENKWEFDTCILLPASQYNFDFKYYLYRRVEIILPNESKVLNMSKEPTHQYVEEGKVHLVYEFPSEPLNENIKVTYILQSVPPITSQPPLPATKPAPIFLPLTRLWEYKLILVAIAFLILGLGFRGHLKKRDLWE